MRASAVTIPTSQTEKQRLRELKQPVQSHRTELGLRAKQPDPVGPPQCHANHKAHSTSGAHARHLTTALRLQSPSLRWPPTIWGLTPHCSAGAGARGGRLGLMPRRQLRSKGFQPEGRHRSGNRTSGGLSHSATSLPLCAILFFLLWILCATSNQDRKNKKKSYTHRQNADLSILLIPRNLSNVNGITSAIP